MRQPEGPEPMPECGYRPISEAGTDFGSKPPTDNPEMFLARTPKSRSDGGGFNYFLIPDPCTWERYEPKPGAWTVRRPKPIPFSPGLPATSGPRPKKQQRQIEF